MHPIERRIMYLVGGSIVGVVLKALGHAEFGLGMASGMLIVTFYYTVLAGRASNSTPGKD